MPVQFVELSASRIQALPPRQTVFFFPVAPVEDHGPHLPVGLDLAEARALCLRTAERLEKEMPGWAGVIMPDAPLGVESNTKQLAITVRAHVLRDWLLDGCRSLKRAGFIHFVCFSGHLGPKQLTAIEEAGKMLTRGWGLVPFRSPGQATLVSASSATISKNRVRSSPFWPDETEHGGCRDTSVGLRLSPEQVDQGYANLVPKKREAFFWTRAWDRLRGKTAGYWGNPAGASAEAGQELLTGTIEEIFPKLRAVWEGANANHIFRSWYSILPPNKAFFKIWILACVLLIVMWFWIVVTIRGIG
ncbi:MAG: hypothetical protein A2428_00610 [Bdellovibrionales bacterium RIFOXYC1_FULL_54_43]|nr:MAG: hypothetical protein A2428_00610 [Bdellovibrionales bacterium RIFOXYC1_FULL_54_43]OFZ83862.1 MAG: hypothetical protein A2603_09040 [Bdellovibrionales bacterium RIFOXYD1_FULL_55_31]